MTRNMRFMDAVDFTGEISEWDVSRVMLAHMNGQRMKDYDLSTILQPRIALWNIITVFEYGKYH